MIRHRAAERRRALPVSQMAAIAGRRIQSVIVADVARRARRRRGRNVHSRQRKSRRAVVECCRKKAHRRVASGAARYRKCGCGRGVRRIRRSLPTAAVVCVQMAARSSASGRGDIQSVVSADVAQTAGHGGVRIGQRESRRIVIENSRRPGSDRMAGRARVAVVGKPAVT